MAYLDTRATICSAVWDKPLGRERLLVMDSLKGSTVFGRMCIALEQLGSVPDSIRAAATQSECSNERLSAFIAGRRRPVCYCGLHVQEPVSICQDQV